MKIITFKLRSIEPGPLDDLTKGFALCFRAGNQNPLFLQLFKAFNDEFFSRGAGGKGLNSFNLDVSSLTPAQWRQAIDFFSSIVEQVAENASFQNLHASEFCRVMLRALEAERANQEKAPAEEVSRV